MWTSILFAHMQILINCNLDYCYACEMCKEFGIASRAQGSTRKKKKGEEIQHATSSSPYDELRR